MPLVSLTGTVTSASNTPFAVAVMVVASLSFTGLGLALKSIRWPRPSSSMVISWDDGVPAVRLAGSGAPRLTVKVSSAVSMSRTVSMVAVALNAPAANWTFAGACHSLASAGLLPDPATFSGTLAFEAKARSMATVTVTGLPPATLVAETCSVTSAPLPSSVMVTAAEDGAPATSPAGRSPRARVRMSSSLSTSRWVTSGVVPVFSPALMVMLSGASKSVASAVSLAPSMLAAMGMTTSADCARPSMVAVMVASLPSVTLAVAVSVTSVSSSSAMLTVAVSFGELASA